jgi:hypothetical protein
MFTNLRQNKAQVIKLARILELISSSTRRE